ncbi:purine nucleosidase [Pseudoxanthomonas sp. GM95]|uniref:nucleoside hydrolase n=1 Tax=Pseudoxanthomonas sp. GM95 TaxID=1881043 RepID=UPI0008B3F932|nr:nucleoside hydrolase [Pseudoxanthomonas sp. GM95]SEM08609.1 purine nucleosidase [Pseudoxanthomonas sp. GM95]
MIPFRPVVVLLLLVASCAALSSHARAEAPSAPIPVIVDSDFGGDIDDAFAMSLLLASPQFKPLLISASSGDAVLRGKLLKQFLARTGHAGIPLVVGPSTPDRSGMSQADWLAPSAAPEAPLPDAAPAIIAALRAAPEGTVTLIALGPLTTIGAAIQRDPKAFKRLKRVVLMSGSIYKGYGPTAGTTKDTPSKETNAAGDPAALRALLASGVPVDLLPLDATEVALPAELQARLFAARTVYATPLRELYGEWAPRSMWGTVPTLFDVVPVARLLDPAVCTPKPLHVAVDEDGMTRPVAGKPNAGVCLDVDRARVLDLMARRLAPAP